MNYNSKTNGHKKETISELMKDIKTGTSHTVKFLLDEQVENTISSYGIQIRKIVAPLLRLIYLTQTNYKLIIHERVPLSKSQKGRIFVLNHRQADDIVTERCEF